MPFADPSVRRDYMRDYHAEFCLGLRRSESPAVVDAKMDDRRSCRERYLREWRQANRERLSAARRRQRREARLRSLEGALGNVSL